MSDTELSQAMRSALADWKGTENWWQQVGKDTAPHDTSASNSVGGQFFQPQLVQKNFEGTPYGGFFAPITTENRNEMINSLFDGQGQWLKDYLDSGTRPGTFLLSPESEKNAFIDAYDRLMTGFLDARRIKAGEFNMLAFTQGATRDQTLTDREFQHILNQYGFKPSLDAMAPDLSQKWLAFTGGALQGLMDYEGYLSALTYKRYAYDGFKGSPTPVSPSEAERNVAQAFEKVTTQASEPVGVDKQKKTSEFDGLISPEARRQIEKNIGETFFARGEGDLFKAAARAMEDNCGTSVGFEFSPPATPTLPQGANRKSL